MLVLTRKKLERILIGNEIVITVLDTGYGRCKIGITAPKHIPVSRADAEEQTRLVPIGLRATRFEDRIPRGDAKVA